MPITTMLFVRSTMVPLFNNLQHQSSCLAQTNNLQRHLLKCLLSSATTKNESPTDDSVTRSFRKTCLSEVVRQADRWRKPWSQPENITSCAPSSPHHQCHFQNLHHFYLLLSSSSPSGSSGASDWTATPAAPALPPPWSHHRWRLHL